jgi:hypothetical protein
MQSHGASPQGRRYQSCTITKEAHEDLLAIYDCAAIWMQNLASPA